MTLKEIAQRANVSRPTLAAMVEFSLAALLGMGLTAPARRRFASTGRPAQARRRTA
jgi:hypothetical protein